jgi:hypothetical protein
VENILLTINLKYLKLPRLQISSHSNATYSDIAALYPLFRSQLSAVNMPGSALSNFGSQMGFTLPSMFPRSRLLQSVDWVLKDDELLRVEGIQNLTDYELVEALEERGAVFSSVVLIQLNVLILFFFRLSLGFTTLANQPLDNIRLSLVNHLKFTKAVTDAALRNRAPGRGPTMFGNLLHADELAAITSLMVLARSLNVSAYTK